MRNWWVGKRLLFPLQDGSLLRDVLNALPFYTMQTSKILVSVLDEIDRIVRCFVWGHETGTRKLHLINWDTLTRPTDCGGLGLQSMRHLNRAALTKTTWHFLNEPDGLWVSLLRAKYVKQASDDFAIVSTPTCSKLWRGLASSWSFVSSGVRWKVENRAQVCF